MKNKNLKNIINKKNISINELSRITHLNDSHLGKIINGKTKNPGIDYLLAIAEALDLNDHEFAELCGYRKEWWIMSTKKEDFKYNVETLACGNDKLQLLDELMKLKNSDGFNLLEILTALTAYDDPKFKNQRDEILTHNCANVLKAELLIYDFGEYYNYNENNKSIEEALTLLESDRFKVKAILNVYPAFDFLKNSEE